MGRFDVFNGHGRSGERGPFRSSQQQCDTLTFLHRREGQGGRGDPLFDVLVDLPKKFLIGTGALARDFDASSQNFVCERLAESSRRTPFALHEMAVGVADPDCLWGERVIADFPTVVICFVVGGHVPKRLQLDGVVVVEIDLHPGFLDRAVLDGHQLDVVDSVNGQRQLCS